MSWIEQPPDDAMDGAFTAVGPDPVRTVEPAVFREAMSRLGAAVHVITTAGPGGKAGTTATAVCSVSDAPPTLLVCLNRRSQTNPLVVENGVFCVNTLGHDGADIADVFAGRTGVAGGDRFASGEWRTLSTGSPAPRPTAPRPLSPRPDCPKKGGGLANPLAFFFVPRKLTIRYSPRGAVGRW